jgi:hypothetical protein
MTTRHDFLKAGVGHSGVIRSSCRQWRSRRPDVGEEAIDLTGEVL